MNENFNESETINMKATGIVRRIDDLGRVVIPKEIRRTMHIREGEPLEIYTDRDGVVIFKKYSPVGELSEHSATFADVLSKVTGATVAVTDRDTVVAASGNGKKDLSEKSVSGEAERLLETRQVYTYKPGSIKPLQLIEDNPASTVSSMTPIIADGDVIGSVTVLCGEKPAAPGDVELKLAQTAASFLGKQVES
jgi:AbrB family transcriptional regulator (stage V sporulation protein T)